MTAMASCAVQLPFVQLTGSMPSRPMTTLTRPPAVLAKREPNTSVAATSEVA